MADGSITFSTELDNKELEKQYQQLKKKIEKLEETVGQKKQKQSPLIDEAKSLSARTTKLIKN